MRLILGCLVVVLVVAGAPSAVRGAEQEAIRIADRWELLVDRYLIEQMDGAVELRLHEPAP
jgi:microcompartment protein CcmL/EutN